MNDPTVATYDNTAQQMAEHFETYNASNFEAEIKRALELAGSPEQPRIVEAGCGAGKDAALLSKLAGWYEGFDPSEGLLEIARKALPGVSFVKAAAQDYIFPKNLDAVFAFASLLHVDKEDFAGVCKRIASSLRPGGVFCLTLKEGDKYRTELQEDEFGQRRFYYYNVKLVCQLAGPAFEKVFEKHELVGPKQKPWFTIILRNP